MKSSFAVLVLFVLLLCAALANAESTVLASWYGPGFEGRTMANSCRFCGNDPTIAAHRTLPLGTKLLLENPVNGKRLVVVVKDRGPHRTTGRELDLSFAGAKKLGFSHKGTAVLAVKVIG